MNSVISQWSRFGGDNPPELLKISVMNTVVSAYRDCSGRFYIEGAIATKALGYKHLSSCTPNVSDDNKIKYNMLIINDINLLTDVLEVYIGYNTKFPDCSRLKRFGKDNPIIDRVNSGGYLSRRGIRVSDSQALKDRINFKEEYSMNGGLWFLSEQGLYEAILAGKSKECKAIRKSVARLMINLRKGEFLSSIANEDKDLIELFNVVRSVELGVENKPGSLDNDNEYYVKSLERFDDQSNPNTKSFIEKIFEEFNLTT